MRAAAVALVLLLAAPAHAAPRHQPVIDMHLHAFTVDFAPGAAACPGSQDWLLEPIDPLAEFTPESLGPCPHPILGATTNAGLVRDTVAALETYNIRRGVLSGEPDLLATWTAASPRFILALGFGTENFHSPEEMRRLVSEGKVRVFAEVTAQYRGVEIGDPRYEPFFALAEELDIPVGIHMGEGPPAAGRFPGYETYRARLTTPFQLEEVLRRHPRLRVYVMHYGSPLVDEMMAMMFTYPNLYVDVAWNDWGMRRAQFYDHLKRMIDAGFEKRIMFGSDQMIWPDAIGEAVRSIDDAPFLSATQKREIFYDNAARFLRLTPEEIARDHAG
jgi:predicted TIM-barrel fold metal-dependent hydrolase